MTSVSPVSSSTRSAEALTPPPERQAPWDPIAEQAVLGAMLIDNDAALKAAQLLNDDSFYRDAHRRVFRAMVGLLERNDVVDPVVLRSELEKRGDLEAAGGIEYLSVLSDAVPTAANVEYHCTLVRDAALRRQLIHAGTAIVQSAYEGREDADNLLDLAEHSVFEVSTQRTSQEFVRLKTLIWDAIERVEAINRGETLVQGVPTGFVDLDNVLGGLHGSDLIIVAARPSVGKTAFCLNVAAHAAIEKQTRVAIFSLEMSKEQVVERLLASECFIDLWRFRKGKMRDDDFPRLSKAAGVLGSAPIWIDDTPAPNLLELRSKARRMKAEHDIGLFIIDYLQLLPGPPRSESRQVEISFISRSLKALARELKTPVIALSQLSRAPEQRGGSRRPMLSDLRESGAIEQDADVVLLLYRSEIYKAFLEKGQEAEEGVAEVIVAKHRNGPTGTVKLAFRKESTRFDNLAPQQPEGSPVV